MGTMQLPHFAQRPKSLYFASLPCLEMYSIIQPFSHGEVHDFFGMMYHESAGEKNSDQTLTTIDY
jgi:hypothetical protein